MHTIVYCGKRCEQPASEYGHSYDVVQRLRERFKGFFNFPQNRIITKYINIKLEG